MVDVETQINQEIELYVKYCRAAAEHDSYENFYRMVAHNVFYHIQEMRTTGKITFLAPLNKPIS